MLNIYNMKYIFVIILIILLTLLFQNLNNKETFSSKSKIYYLIDKENNTKALFKDITKYTKPSNLKGAKAVLLDGKKSAAFLKH